MLVRWPETAMWKSSRIKPWLQLVRLPNVFTAGADSLAGWLVARGGFEHPEQWMPLVLASMAIYAAGIALNDYFDRDLDAQERPFRPIPSGAVRPGMALGLAVGLLVGGLGLAVGSGSVASLAVAAALVACVVGYDASLRTYAVGPVVMGACRGLNFLLGASQVPALGGPVVWVAAGSVWVFVMGLTWISRSETEIGRKRGVVLGLVLENVGLGGLVAAGWMGSRIGSEGGIWTRLILGGLVLGVVAALVNRAGLRAVREAVPKATQLAVKTSVLSLVWLNVGVVAAVRGPGQAVAVAVLWVPAYVLAKWLYAT